MQFVDHLTKGIYDLVTALEDYAYTIFSYIFTFGRICEIEIFRPRFDSCIWEEDKILGVEDLPRG